MSSTKVSRTMIIRLAMILVGTILLAYCLAYVFRHKTWQLSEMETPVTEDVTGVVR